MRALRIALVALAAALLVAAPGHAAAPVKVSAPNNANFARSLVVQMPGYDMPPAGQFKMELRRRPGAPVDFTFSTAIGNLRVVATDAPARRVTLAMLGPQAQMAALSGSYVADLIYWEGAETAALGDFIFAVTRGVTDAPALSTPAYDDLAAWGPIVDISGASAATVLALHERGLTGPQGPAGPPGATDHGALTGLDDDDHPQYLTAARGDARYPQIVHGHAAGDVSGLAPVATSGAYADLSGRPALGAAAALGVGAGLSSANGSIVLGDGAGVTYDSGARTVTIDSAAGQSPLVLSEGGAEKLRLDPSTGGLRAAWGTHKWITNHATAGPWFGANGANIAFGVGGANIMGGPGPTLQAVTGFSIGYGYLTTPDVILTRDAAGVFAVRNGANAQRVNFYSSWTDAANLVRGYVDAGKSTAGVLRIGSENLGTSGAKLTKFQIDVDGASRADYGVTTPGAWTFSGGVSCSGAPTASFAVVGGVVTHC